MVNPPENIKQVPLKESEYFKEEHKKNQITLHHTAGNSSGVNVAQAWNVDTRGRIATPFIISGSGAKNSKDGEIVQCFSSKHWAYHLGIKGEVFKARGIPHQILDKLAIGIEICNWGQLEKVGDKYMTYVDSELKSDHVTTLDKPYKGYIHFHRYTDAQIESVRNLLLYLADTYVIDLTFDYDQMFNVSNNALAGVNGLYTHNSYRKDKIDIYPCPRMIEMLKGITQ